MQRHVVHDSLLDVFALASPRDIAKSATPWAA